MSRLVVKKKLPLIDTRSDFVLTMKFYWARENQKNEDHERLFTGGIYTKVPGANGLHPVFLDYDWVSLRTVEESVRFLQKKWKLGNAYIYSSLGNKFYHVKFFYDWVEFRKLIKIMRSDERIDEGFIKMSEKKGGAVLRTCAKSNNAVPKFVKILKSQYQKNKTKNELDWGDMLRLSTEALLGQKETWIKDFRNGELLKKRGRK